MASHESELFKDKIEVSLDGRQIFYLFFGGAVIATLVFVLGVMVGRRVEARAVVETGSVASDPLAALDRLEGRGGDLAFASALRGDDVSLGSVDATLARSPAVGGPMADARAKDKSAEEHGEAVEEEEVPAIEEVAEESHDKAQESAEAKANAEAKAAEAKAKAEAKASENAASKAASVEAKAAESEAKKAAAKDEDKRPMRFTLQVGSFQDKIEADDFFRKLEATSYKPYMVEAEVPGKGTYYRVRIGGYAGYEDAVAAKTEFEAKLHIIAYVTRLKN